jgi:hypothetical protein
MRSKEIGEIPQIFIEFLPYQACVLDGLEKHYPERNLQSLD